MLKLNNCTKTFKKKRALDCFSLEFEPGVYGLLGPNGAGKTTLMRCICDLYNLDEGSIEKPERIGYLPQKFGMFKQLKVYDMMEYFSILKNIDKTKRDAEIRSCVEAVNLSDRLFDRVKSLSGGMVRRIGIAQAILGNPDIIIFDEPTAGLDPEERMRFKNIIRQISGDNIIIISTHIVSDVEAVCDHIILMDKGKLIFSGTGTDISNIGKNKVYLVEADKQNDLQNEYYIKDRVETDNRSYLRILSNQQQPGKIITPTLEDGYICALKNF